MPFSTSVAARARAAAAGRARSIQPVTRPSFGEIRAMRSVCQTLAKISPLTYSSSLSCSPGGPRGHDGDPAGLLQRRGIEEAQRTAVPSLMMSARAVVRQPPALAGVAERLRRLERLQVVDEADLRLPGELDERSFQSVMPSPKYCAPSGFSAALRRSRASPCGCDERPLRPVPS